MRKNWQGSLEYATGGYYRSKVEENEDPNSKLGVYLENVQAADKQFYDGARWKRLRAVKLGRDPLCEECKRQGRTVVAQQVHHKTPRKVNQSLAYDIDNTESLCASCHSKETAREMGSQTPRGAGSGLAENAPRTHV